MDFHLPSLTTMNNMPAFSRLGALWGEGRSFRADNSEYRDRSRPVNAPALHSSLHLADRTTVQAAQDGARTIKPKMPKMADFWTTADVTSIDGRDLWMVAAPQRSSEEEGLAFFCFDLETPRDIGFTMSMRAADPGPSAFEIVVTGHVISRHYTVVDRFISRTFTIPAAVLNAGRNALSISAIPGYHGIWIESAGIGPLA